jgi:hypothetical protein
MARPSNAERIKSAAESALRAAGAVGPTFVDLFLSQANLAFDSQTKEIPQLASAIDAWKALHPELFSSLPSDEPQGITVAEKAPVFVSVGIGVVGFKPGQRLDNDPHLLSMARHYGIALHEPEG